MRLPHNTRREVTVSMETLKTILIVLECLMSVALVLVVLFQSGKEAGLSGALSGSSDSYLNKNKSASLDKKLATSTKWIAAVWAILTLSLSLI